LAALYDRPHTSSMPKAGPDKSVGSVLRPHQHSIGYMGDGFYRSKDPTNSIKVLKEMLQKRKKMHTQNDIHKIITASPLSYNNMG